MALTSSALAVIDVEPRMLPVAESIALSIATSPVPERLERRLVAAGRTLAQTLSSESIAGPGLRVYVGGVEVPAHYWHLVRVKPGQLVEVRPAPGKKIASIGAMLALSYLTFGAGLGAAAAFDLGLGAAGALGGLGIPLVQGAIMMGGTLVINKLLGPKPAGGAAAVANAAPATYSIAAGSNSPRLYAPLGLLLGEAKYPPDLAAQQYTYFEGEDQFLACRLHAGINCASVDQIKVGDTLLSQYEGVRLTFAGFPYGNNGAMPSTTVDAIPGALLDNPAADGSFGAWTTRTTSLNTVRIALDIEATLTATTDSGAYQRHYADIELQYRAVGSTDWLPLLGGSGVVNLTNLGAKPLRATYSADVPAGRYEVQARKRSANDTITTQQNAITWTQLKSYQADTADYAGQPQVLIEVKATGQLNGGLNTVNLLGRARALDLWNGTSWVQVSEPGAAGISNPGALLLQLYRGIYNDNGRLLAGFGQPDSRIDMESLKAFMVRCTAKNFRFDLFLQQQMSLQDLCNAIADAGLGRLSRRTGKYGVVWLAEDQPIEGIINMARMKARSFSVDYDLSPTADELEYQFYDADADWVQNPVRVVDPTVTGTPQRSASMPTVGITRAEHAALRARFTLGQSLYARKSITCELDLEHLNYPPGSVVALSHDLTQWGYSGRLAGFSRGADSFTLQLDGPLPAVTGALQMMGLQLPGAPGMRVYSVADISADRRTVRIDVAWPGSASLPGVDRPARDTVWIFDFKASPGLRTRVVSASPVDDMKGARMAFVPESAEFWNYVWGGPWTQPGNDSLLPVTPPAAGNASISAERVRVGEAWRIQLTVVFDAAGNYDHAQVWGSADGALMVPLGETGGTRLSWYADAGRQWSVEVRPFDGLGRLGGIATALYNVASNPPANVLGLALDMTAAGVVASWKAPTGISAVDWSLTEVRRGAAFDTAPVIYSGRGTTVALGWLLAGTTTIWARQKSTAGEWSDPVSTALVVQTPAQPNVIAGRDLSLVSFRWNDCTTSQPIKAYQVRDGATFDGATSLGQVTATSYTRNEAAAGVHKYWVQAVDAAGNVGAPGSVTIETLPGFEQAKAELTAGLDNQADLLVGQGNDLPDPATLIRPLLPLALSTAQLLTGSPTGDPATFIPLLRAGVGPALQDIDAINRRTLDSLAQTHETQLRAALEARKATKLVRDAGIYRDPTTGVASMYALDHTTERLVDVSVSVDALKGQVALRATKVEVAQAVLAAQLDPTGKAALDGLMGQITEIELTLDTMNGTLGLKASQSTVTELNTRVVQVRQELDVAKQQLTSKVETADFTNVKNAIEGRVGRAEQTLQALGDVSEIVSTAAQTRTTAAALDDDAATRLRGTLADWKARKALREASALATNELRAFVDANFAAEASSREFLEVQMRQADSLQLARVDEEARVRYGGDAVNAEAVKTLRAELQTAAEDLIAQIQDVEHAQVTATGALTESTKTLAAQSAQAARDLVAGAESNLRNTLQTWKSGRAARAAAALATSELRALVDGNAAAEASKLDRLAVEVDTVQSSLRGEISNASKVAANATKVVADQLDVATAQFQEADIEQTAQLSAVASQQATATEAVAHQVETLATQTQTALGTVSAQISDETSARTTALAAEAARIDALLLQVDQNQVGVTSSINGLVNEQASQAGRIDGVVATAGENSTSIVIQQQVLADLAGKLSAIYSLGVSAGGKVTGMVIDGVEQTIVFMAGRVAFAAEEDGVITYPFIVGQVAGVPTALVDGNFMATGTVKASALDVDRLSAISAVLGVMNAACLDITGDGAGGWGYVRSNPKWIDDGINGYVLARHADGNAFFEFKAGSSRIAGDSRDGSFVIDTPGFFSKGGQTILRALGVVETLNVAGNAITALAYLDGPTNDLVMGFTLDGTEPASVEITAFMTIAFQSNFTLEVDGDQKFNETPGSGTLASRPFSMVMSPGFHSIRVWSADGRNNTSAALSVKGIKR